MGYSRESLADSPISSTISLPRAVRASLLNKKIRPALDPEATLHNRRYGAGLLTLPGILFYALRGGLLLSWSFGRCGVHILYSRMPRTQAFLPFDRLKYDAYSLGRRYRSDIDLGRQLPIVAANKVLAAPDVKAHPSRSWIYARGLRLLATA